MFKIEIENNSLHNIGLFFKKLKSSKIQTIFLANTACLLGSIKNRPLVFTPIFTRPSQLTSTRRGSLVIRCMGSVRNDCKDNP